jgi:hypothetical protein
MNQSKKRKREKKKKKKQERHKSRDGKKRNADTRRDENPTKPRVQTPIDGSLKNKKANNGRGD